MTDAMDDVDATNILNLPYEVIEMIADFCTIDDLANLKNVCKAFAPIAYSPVWADKVCLKWPLLERLRAMEVDWYQVYLDVMETDEFCWNFISTMPERYYEAGRILPEDDLTVIFNKTKEYAGLGMIYTKLSLMRLCQQKISYQDTAPVQDKPNMCHQYYAAMVLDYLVQFEMRNSAGRLLEQSDITPEKVFEFFSEWVEPKYGSPSKLIQSTIDRLTKMVFAAIPPEHPLHKIDESTKKSWANKLIPDNYLPSKYSTDIIKLICNVLKREEFIRSVDADLDSFLVRNDTGKISSNRILGGIYFESVARRCGIRVDLFYFTNHNLVVWRESWAGRSPMFLVDLYNSTLRPSASRCPYAREEASRPPYAYAPINLLDTIVTSFKELVNYHPRMKKNVLELSICICKNQIQYESSFDELTHVHSELNNYVNSPKEPRLRSPNLKYAVGMVCFHKNYHYKCVIRGWDLKCMESSTWKRNMGINRLEFGENQPFYKVVAADLSSRYVAEENLKIVMDPSYRQENIEVIIGEEFSHFNGMFYVPNKQKEAVFPGDAIIRSAFYKIDSFQSKSN